MLEKDISDNRSIGEFGAKAILNNVTDGEQVRILTHCNTGSLATAYFGTALGVVRCLHSASRLGKIFFYISYIVPLPFYKSWLVNSNISWQVYVLNQDVF